MLHVQDLSIIDSLLSTLDQPGSSATAGDEYRLMITLYQYPLTLALILLLYHLLAGSKPSRMLRGWR